MKKTLLLSIISFVLILTSARAFAVTPTISESGSLSALSTTYGTASSAITFSVSGSNLTAGILVTAPAGYEVSLTGLTFSSTVTIPEVLGITLPTTVYIRLAATTAAGTYSGNVVMSSAGATSVNLATVASTVNKAALTITANNVSKVYGAALTSGAGSTAFTSTALQNGQTIGSVTITYGTGALATAGVGTYTGSVVASAATGGTFTASNYNITYVAGNITVTAAVLTITANSVSKVYGTTLTGGTGSTAFTSSGLQNGETIGSVTIAYGTGSAIHDPVATNTSTITISSATGGTFTAGNYTITYVKGNITVTAVTLTVTGVVASNKVYDGTTTATVSGGVLTGVISPDVVSISTTGTFATANVGTGIAVTVALTGAAAGNYILTQPGVTANITAKTLTENGATVSNKVYDATTNATVSGGTLSGVISPDVVSISTTGIFATANVGTGIGVTLVLTGAGASNYTLTQPGLTANITAVTLTITGISITTKTYDGTTTGSISGSASLVGVIGTDVVNLGGNPVATFASKNVGTGIAVTVTGYIINGAASGNYVLTQPSGITGIITTTSLTVAATGPTKIAGATSPVVTGSTTNFTYFGTVTGETVTSVTLTPNPTTSQTAGQTYTVTPSAAAGTGGFLASNYTINYIVYNGVCAGKNYVWTGTTSTTWSTTTNWSPNGTPTSTDLVSIPATTNAPTITSSTSVNTITFTGNNTLTVNSGLTLTVDNGFNINSGVTNAALTFAGTSITTNMQLSSANLTNLGTFTLSGTGYVQVQTNGSYIFNSGTFTVDNNATLYVSNGSSSTAAITNAGTFYAGISGSNCNIEMDDYGSIDNSGTFYLGPTSIMYYYNDNAQQVIIKNEANGTFTLQSDATGSASIGEIPQGKGDVFTGTFSVQRFFQGNSTFSAAAQRWIGRNYRIISSPVNNGLQVNSNYVFGLNYIVGSTAGQTTTANSSTNAFVTGCNGCSTTAGNPSIYVYNESITPSNSSYVSGNFLGITNITNSTSGGTIGLSDGSFHSLPVGTGVFFFFRGAATNFTQRTSNGYMAPENVTLTSTGNINQGSYTYKDWYTTSSSNLGYTGTGTGTNYAVRGFNMIGNPYACAIDWCEFYTSGTNGITRTNINPTIWVFNPLTSHYDTFLATSSSGGTATGSASRYIASGQGFVVQANNTGAVLTISEYAKVLWNVNRGVNDGVLPTGSQLTGTNLLMSTSPVQAAVQPSLRLKMVTDSTNYDDIYIGFNASASPSYNGNEDAKYLPGDNALESLASYSADSIKLAINNLPLPKLSPQVIRLFASAKAYGTYNIQLSDLQAMPKIYDIWLMDNYKKDSLDMRANSNYVFDILPDTNSYGSNRFSVVIRQNPALVVHLLNFTATKAQLGSQVVWVTENEENYTDFAVERSVDGGTTWAILGGVPSAGQGTYSYLDKAPVIGANSYRLQITDLNGTITYSNVVTILYGGANSLVKTGIDVYPNPAKSTLNLSIASGFTGSGATISLASTTSGGQYNVQITNILGSVVRKASISQQNWQTDVSDLTPGTYVIQVTNKATESVVGQGTFIKL